MLLTLTTFIDTSSALQIILELPRPICLSGAWSQPDINRQYDILSAAPIIQLQQQTDHLIVKKDNQPFETVDITSIDWLEKYLNGTRKHNYQKPQTINNETLPTIYGFIGYISYDYGRRLEKISGNTINDIQLPDFSGGIYVWNFINDKINKQSYLAFHPLCPAKIKTQVTSLFTVTQAKKTSNCKAQDISSRTRPTSSNTFSLTSPFVNNTSKGNYKQSLSSINNYIKKGDCYQINFSHRHTADYKGNAVDAFAHLNHLLNTPYSAYLKHDDFEILSLSPERFIKINGNTVETKPIKGTINRGHNKNEDIKLKQQLLNSKKDRSENLMIVDLLRNDLNRTCLPGSVKVPTLFNIETYPNVHHLVSTITGTKHNNISALNVLTQAFPGGSITGAPKIRAMEIIEELEPTRRSIYCGSIFYIDFNGNMDSNICIRTLLCKDETIYCWGGGGIVADSNCEDEYQESITKIKNLMDALEEMSGLR